MTPHTDDRPEPGVELASHRATLEFSYRDPDDAIVVERSVGPEVGEIEGDRARATVDRRGATLTVEVAAADFTALRAGLTTWLTFVDVATAALGTPAASTTDGAG